MNAKEKFFLWCYYPIENHIASNYVSFLDEYYASWSGKPNKEDRQNMINEFVEYTSFDLWNHEMPCISTSLRLDESILTHGMSTSSNNPRGYPSKGIHHERKGCMSFEIKFRDPIDELWQQKSEAYRLIFKSFALNFRPVFGFGHRMYNRWHLRGDSIPPPETRIWPYNVYNLSQYPRSLEQRLREFTDDNPAWILDIKGDIAIFHIDDLSTPEEEIPKEVTLTVLGEGDGLLVPSKGYPPPQTWRDLNDEGTSGSVV